MNSRAKIIIGYILSFITFILLLILSISIIIKFSILDKNYIKKNLENISYYENINSDIKDDMESYMISSGLENNILNDIYTIDDIKNDVNNYIDNIYEGKNNNINTDTIKIKLENNIDKYLKDNNINFKGSELDEFVIDIINYYTDEINLYDYLNDYVKYIVKLNNIVIIIIIVSIIFIIVNLFIAYKLTKNNYFGSILLVTGLFLLFLQYDIFDKIDINNIFIITKYFSEFVQIILNNLKIFMILYSLILSLLGIILIINNAFVKKNDEIML